MRVHRIAPLVVVPALLIASCSSSTKGKGEQSIDVEKVKITTTVPMSGSAHGPALISPDGQRVLTAGDGKACVAGLDGSQQVCSDSKVSIDPSRAAWSPDGTHVAFTDNFYKNLEEPDIWVLDAATGKATDLTDDGVGKTVPGKADPKANYDLLPSWSADGKSIRFARQAGGYAGDTTDIDSVPVGGGEVSKLGTLPVRLIELAGLAFAPDGKTAAWSQGSDSGWTKSTVHVGHVDGGAGRTLTPAPDTGDQSLLSFSADGEYLLVDSSAPYGQYSCCSKSSAKVYHADGSGGVPVARDVVALYPGWAPSGHALAFTTPIPHANVDLVAEPGGPAHTLKSSDRGFGAPNTLRLQWTPAGLFVFDGGASTLYHLS